MAIHTKQSPGDVIDRVTILLLKSYYLDKPHELITVLTELGHILPAIIAHLNSNWDTVQHQIKDLRDTNRKLWHHEELIRNVLRDDTDEITKDELACMISAIHKMNLERSKIKRCIDIAVDTDFTEMKDYGSLTDKKPTDSGE